MREVCILFDGPMRSIATFVREMHNFPNGGCGIRGYLMRHWPRLRDAIPTLGNRGGRRAVKNYADLSQKPRQFLDLCRRLARTRAAYQLLRPMALSMDPIKVLRFFR